MMSRSNKHKSSGKRIILPKFNHKGGMTLVESLLLRRSRREYTGEELNLGELSQLLWAGQGITGNSGERTAPSAGALFPIEIYVAAGRVEDLVTGIYKYGPKCHELMQLDETDVRTELYHAALRQECVRDGAVVIVLAGVFKRTTHTYGERGVRYVHMDVAHAAQNILLQAVALKMGSVVIGAFDDDKIKEIMKMERGEDPLYLIPVGRVSKPL
jgi:SagB-type dehydrogenase family enzyme